MKEIAGICNGLHPEPTLCERIDTAILQLKLAVEEKGERQAIPEARKQIALYLRSFRGASQLRALINRSTSFLEVEAALLSLKSPQ